MTYDQYWYGDTRLLKVYYDAYKLRQEEQNRNAWLNGVYVYRAISSIASALTAKQDTDIEPYPTSPIDLFGTEQDEQSESDAEERDRLLARAWMQRLVEIGKTWSNGKPQTAETNTNTQSD